MFGPCKGDSGSPLVRFDFSGSGSQPKYVITGIVQGGVGRCGDDKFPSIFVRVEDPEVYNFIAKTIGVQGSTSQVSAVSQRIRTTTTTTTRSPPTTTTPSSEQGLKKVVGLAQDALYEVFKLTISQGVPIDEPNNEGNTHLLTTAKVGNLKTVKLLVDTGANINRVNNLGQNAVLMAARNNGTSDEIVRYFVERGVNYFLKDKNGNNALSLAADVGNLPSVKYLYSKGLSIESADNDGETALMLASFKHFFKTAEYLLEKGASPRVVTNNGLNALHQVGISGDVPIARILIDKGANLNAQSEFGFTAFFYAAGHGHLDLVKYLKRRGANINITSVKNETPLLNAARYGHSDVVSWLLKEAPSQAYVKDNDGNTPVSEASKNNREETLKILLDSGLFRAAG